MTAVIAAEDQYGDPGGTVGARAVYGAGRRAGDSTATSRSHAPETMNRNDAIIPTPIAYRPHVCPKNRIAAPACSMT
jgi:hypothetical protein